MTLFCPKQLYLSIYAVLNSLFAATDYLPEEEIRVKVWNFLMNVGSVQLSDETLNANVVSN